MTATPQTPAEFLDRYDRTRWVSASEAARIVRELLDDRDTWHMRAIEAEELLGLARASTSTGDCEVDCEQGCAYPGQFSECEP